MLTRIPVTRCRGCGAALAPSRTRPRLWCSDACRVRAWRADQRRVIEAARVFLASAASR
jgi:hypothetical protein